MELTEQDYEKVSYAFAEAFGDKEKIPEDNTHLERPKKITKEFISEAAVSLKNNGIVVIEKSLGNKDANALYKGFSRFVKKLQKDILEKKTKDTDDYYIVFAGSEVKRYRQQGGADKKKPLVHYRCNEDYGLVDIFYAEKALSESHEKIFSLTMKADFISEIIKEAYGKESEFAHNNCYMNDNITNTRGYHYDSKSGVQIKVFMYLTDVETEDSGPYCYARGSHQIPDLIKINDLANKTLGWRKREFHFFNREREMKILGKKGTMIISNQTGAHRGWPQAMGHSRMLVVQNVLMKDAS